MLILNEFIFLIVLCTFASAMPPQIQVVDLRAEYLDKPTGIIGSPRFSWILAENGYNLSATRGQKQTAFQLLVCSQSACLKGDVWDSGKIVSAKSFLVKYGGQPLQSSTKYYWYADDRFDVAFAHPIGKFEPGTATVCYRITATRRIL